MDTELAQTATQHPGRAAVTCGRIVFFFVGFVLMAIPLMLAYGGFGMSDPAEWACLIAGFLMIVLGAILPPKVVARAGFDLPFFLPDGD